MEKPFELVATIKADYQAQLVRAEEVKVEIVEKIKGVDDLGVAIEEYGAARETKGWDGAMAQAGQAGAEGKIYSEQEMNEEIAVTKAPLEAKIAELGLEIEALKLQVTEAGPAAVAAFKAELKAQYEAQQVVESTSETGFKALLD